MTTLRTIIAMPLAVWLLAGPLLAGQQAGPSAHETLPAQESGSASGSAVPRLDLADGGRRVIEARGLSLAGDEFSVFSLSEDAGHFAVTIGSGGLDFAMSPDVGSVAFTTPRGSVHVFPVLRDTARQPASGHILVDAETAVLSVTNGTLEIASGQSRQALHTGRVLVLTNAAGADPSPASHVTASAGQDSGRVNFRLAIGFGVVSILTAAGVAGAQVTQDYAQGTQEVSPH